MRLKRGMVWIAGLLVGMAYGTAAAQAPAKGDVILATTTSTQDSGLLDVLFERQSGYRVKIIAVGTGQSLAMGARGDADLVLVHAPSLEKKYVAEGAFVNRRLVMYNDLARPLQNIYHVMELNPTRFPKANLVGGKAFADFMVSPAAQTVVQTFGVDKFGQPLFFPAVGKREEDLAGGED